jgi:hypothetical protein
METKFKVGDRVRHVHGWDSTVEYVSSDGLRCYVVTNTMRDSVINVSSDRLKLIEPAPTALPTPDRAMIAAMCLQGLLSSFEFMASRLYDGHNFGEPAAASVRYADALIAELEKPKQ